MLQLFISIDCTNMLQLFISSEDCEAAFHLGARGLGDGFCTGTEVGDVPTDLRHGAFFPCPDLSVAAL
jgi:hypothetical protein